MQGVATDCLKSFAHKGFCTFGEFRMRLAVIDDGVFPQPP